MCGVESGFGCVLCVRNVGWSFLWCIRDGGLCLRFCLGGASSMVVMCGRRRGGSGAWRVFGVVCVEVSVQMRMVGGWMLLEYGFALCVLLIGGIVWSSAYLGECSCCVCDVCVGVMRYGVGGSAMGCWVRV